MSAAVVSPASSTAAPSTAAQSRTRVAASSAAKAYAALQYDPMRQTGQVPHHHPHHGGKALASPSGNAAQLSAATPNAGGALNILA